MNPPSIFFSLKQEDIYLEKWLISNLLLLFILSLFFHFSSEKLMSRAYLIGTWALVNPRGKFPLLHHPLSSLPPD